MAVMANQPVAIRLEGIVKSFMHNVKGQVSAVDNVSISVAPGELLTLLGPSGCGKTTTLRMIAGFEQPTQGSIYIGENNVTSLRANERNIGFVFQNYAIFPHLSVFENVAYGLRVQKKPEKEIEKAVTEVLELVGLSGYAKQQPHQMSGGEQQRIALARAIVFHPRILMFDEPLSNLDAKLRGQMRGEIRDLQKRLGITTVYVTHDQEEAMAISDRIAVMDKGSVIQIDTAQELYARPCNEFMANFIGKSNLLRGQVVQTSNAHTQVRVFDQTLQCDTLIAGLKEGDSVRIVIRPEQISIGKSGNTGCQGKIVSKVFLGEKTEYQIAVGDDLLQAVSFGLGQNLQLAIGDSVQLNFPADGNHLIPG